jgi:hypothetical protein
VSPVCEPQVAPFGEIKACAKAGIEAIKDKLDF